MNDQELITAVKESISSARMPVPVDRILSRSRVIRARRRMTSAAAGAAMAAVAALAVAALLPSARQPGQPPGPQPSHPQLAAWTVARQADGDIAVTIREWRDPAGLQAALRADGLRAVVAPPVNPACRPYTASPAVMKAIVHVHMPLVPVGDLKKGAVLLVIDPSAIPRGAGLSFFAPGKPSVTPSSPVIRALPSRAQGALVNLVHASPRCTGS